MAIGRHARESVGQARLAANGRSERGDSNLNVNPVRINHGQRSAAVAIANAHVVRPSGAQHLVADGRENGSTLLIADHG